MSKKTFTKTQKRILDLANSLNRAGMTLEEEDVELRMLPYSSMKSLIDQGVLVPAKISGYLVHKDYEDIEFV